MPRLPIIPNESTDKAYPADHSLPPFYMADFTVLGLRVGNVEAAVRLLEENGIPILGGPVCREASIEKCDEIPNIIQLLNAHEISCVITDTVEQVYQG